MLRKPAGDGITATVGDYSISKGVSIHAKVLRRSPTAGRRAIYIHGGGVGGNHTLIERPSRLLVEDGFFDEIILPDRRGDGASSPLTGMMTMREHAGDMKALLDEMGFEGPLTAMGISYGGPMSLTLAHLDSRIERVVLVASSPTLKQTSGLATFLVRTGLLRVSGRLVYGRYVGKLPSVYPDSMRLTTRPLPVGCPASTWMRSGAPLPTGPSLSSRGSRRPRTRKTPAFPTE